MANEGNPSSVPPTGGVQNLASTITGAVLTLTGVLTGARTWTIPDRSLLIRGVSGTQTTNRLSKFDANGDQTDSLVQDGVATGALTLAKAGVTARTATFPDAAINVTGSAAALTANRLPKGTATAGVVQDSQIADAVTGNVLSIAGTLTALRTLTFPDRSLTMRGVSGTQTTGRLNKFDANGDHQDSQIADSVTGGILTMAGTLTATRTATWPDKSGTVAMTSDITGGTYGFKNLLHNGRVEVDQRATLTTPTSIPTGAVTYGPDGWAAYHLNATQVMTLGKVAVVNTPMVGSRYACKLNITTGAALAAGDSTFIRRVIEGTFFRRCNFGTAQAATVYVSLWVESTITGTFSVSLHNGNGDRCYVVNCTISVANTRQLFQIAIPGDTSGTWNTDTSAGGILEICVGAGSSKQITANAWQATYAPGTSSTTNFGSAANSVQVSDLYVGTEQIGTATTDYPHVPYDVELTRCYRYLEFLTVLPSFLSTDTTGTSRCQWWFKATKRATPTITLGGGSLGTPTAFVDGVEIDRSAAPVSLTSGTNATAEL